MKRCSVKPYEGSEEYIFVSYCHKDKAHVFPIIEQLARDGHRIWYDEGIDPGTEWPEIIARHLSGCSLCIAFISQNSLNSHNCRREINFALLKKKTFISIIIEPVQMSLGMEMQLSSAQSIFKYKLPTQSEFFDKLYSAQDLAKCCGSRDDSIVVSKYEDYLQPYSIVDKVREPFSDKWFINDVNANQNKKEEPYSTVGVEERRKAEEARLAAETEERRKAEEARLAAEAEERRKSEEARLAAEAEERRKAEEARLAAEAEERRKAEEARLGVEIEEHSKSKEVVFATEKISHLLKRIKTGDNILIYKDRFVIGRSETRADYIISDNRAISREHVVFYIDGECCYVSDNNSLNKTFVNGQVLKNSERKRLVDGDVINVYNEKFVYSIEEDNK